MSQDILTPYQYMKFAYRWNTRYENLQLYNSHSFQKTPKTQDEAEKITLLDILRLWYGNKAQYKLFHTTDRSTWKILKEELMKDEKRNLRGGGLLGEGFYLTPNARLSFLYGVRTATPRVFKNKWAFVVFQCLVNKQNAQSLKYGIDFYFHDPYTMKKINQPLNGNDLAYLEIVFKTQKAYQSLLLYNILIVAGDVFGDSRSNVFNTYDKIFTTPKHNSRNIGEKYHMYNYFLKDKTMNYVENFGMIFNIDKYAKLIIFDGVISTFLNQLISNKTFVRIFQDIISSLGVNVRIHFNKFHTDNLHTESAKCFIVEGHVVQYDPTKFFSTPQKKSVKKPMAFLSTSKGLYKPILIVPPYTDNGEKYHSIFSFAKEASSVEFFEFFSFTAKMINAVLRNTTFQQVDNQIEKDTNTIQQFCVREGLDKGIYMNFHGGSVGWLHLRLDKYPAYYALDELQVLESEIPSVEICNENSVIAKRKQEKFQQQRTRKRMKMSSVLSHLKRNK